MAEVVNVKEIPINMTVIIHELDDGTFTGYPDGGEHLEVSGDSAVDIIYKTLDNTKYHIDWEEEYEQT